MVPVMAVCKCSLAATFTGNKNQILFLCDVMSVGLLSVSCQQSVGFVMLHFKTPQLSSSCENCVSRTYFHKLGKKPLLALQQFIVQPNQLMFNVLLLLYPSFKILKILADLSSH